MSDVRAGVSKALDAIYRELSKFPSAYTSRYGLGQKALFRSKQIFAVSNFIMSPVGIGIHIYNMTIVVDNNDKHR